MTLTDYALLIFLDQFLQIGISQDVPSSLCSSRKLSCIRLFCLSTEHGVHSCFEPKGTFGIWSTLRALSLNGWHSLGKGNETSEISSLNLPLLPLLPPPRFFLVTCVYFYFLLGRWARFPAKQIMVISCDFCFLRMPLASVWIRIHC